MRPVMMTSFGWPHGNCFAACVASIFELSIEELPCGAVAPLQQGEPEWAWIEPWQDWFETMGLHALTFFAHGGGGENPHPWRGWGILMCKVLGVPLMTDGTELCHAVVTLNGEGVHDPQPGADRSRLQPFTQTVFIATDPAKVRGILRT
jgi:hypothetical protein